MNLVPSVTVRKHETWYFEIRDTENHQELLRCWRVCVPRRVASRSSPTAEVPESGGRTLSRHSLELAPAGLTASSSTCGWPETAASSSTTTPRSTTGELIATLSRWELPAWVPDLSAVMAASDGMIVDVEIKLDPPEPGARLDPGSSRAIGTALAESLGRNDGSILVSSFWPDALIAFCEAASGFATGLLVHPADNARRSCLHRLEPRMLRAASVLSGGRSTARRPSVTESGLQVGSGR